MRYTWERQRVNAHAGGETLNTTVATGATVGMRSLVRPTWRTQRGCNAANNTLHEFDLPMPIERRLLDIATVPLPQRLVPEYVLLLSESLRAATVDLVPRCF